MRLCAVTRLPIQNQTHQQIHGKQKAEKGSSTKEDRSLLDRESRSSLLATRESSGSCRPQKTKNRLAGAVRQKGRWGRVARFCARTMINEPPSDLRNDVITRESIRKIESRDFWPPLPLPLARTRTTNERRTNERRRKREKPLASDVGQQSSVISTKHSHPEQESTKAKQPATRAAT